MIGSQENYDGSGNILSRPQHLVYIAVFIKDEMNIVEQSALVHPSSPIPQRDFCLSLADKNDTAK